MLIEYTNPFLLERTSNTDTTILHFLPIRRSLFFYTFKLFLIVYFVFVYKLHA